MVASVLALALPATAAGAVDNIVPTGTWNPTCQSGMTAYVVCQTDNAGVYYYMDSQGEYELETPDRQAVEAALNEEYAPTDLTITYDSTPVFSGSGETDIIYQEGAFGMPDYVLGITWCDDAVDGSTYECDQSYIRVRGAGVYSKKIACHESGHAVGLTHGTEAYPVTSNSSSILGCMRTPIESMTTADLGSNQVSNINSVY